MPTYEELGPGAVLDGRYRLIERIGRGGMGHVFLAHDARLKRPVALKLLRTQAASDPSQRAMFRREAELMANLRHPNVVAVHDTGEWQARPYLVMPFHEGTDLDRWAMERGGPPLARDVAMELLGQVFVGIGAMHESGVIHGDIKPANILVSEAMEAIVVDLGLSRRMEAPEDARPLTGTPGFVAPELIRRDEVDPALASKVDVYALGVTTYWLLTGRSPWGDGTPMDVLTRQVEGSLVAPSGVGPELPTAVDEPILSALALAPRARPDVDELYERLRAGLGAGERHRPFVLLVDDDPEILLLEEEIVRKALGSAEVVRMLDPRAALSLIAHRSPDLVVTDLQMPRINGVELTAALRGNPRSASIPVIVVTGVGGAQDWPLLRSLGATCMVVKPIEPPMLADAVQRALLPPGPQARDPRPGTLGPGP